jgi:hypothetical protein
MESVDIVKHKSYKMNRIYIMAWFTILTLSLLNISCKKVPIHSQDTTLPPPPPPLSPLPPAANTPPICNTGQDKLVFFPANSCSLNGTAWDLENNIQAVLWSRISGPSSFLIDHSDSLSTKVSNLQIGDYQFELTVTDSMGMTGKDTIKVSVTNMNETIFQNRIWIFPWYSAIEVKEFYNLIPSGSLFRIFIRRDSNPVWIEANPVTDNISAGPYEYFIETRPDGAGIYTYHSLYIFYYGMDTDDTPDVKIVF